MRAIFVASLLVQISFFSPSIVQSRALAKTPKVAADAFPSHQIIPADESSKDKTFTAFLETFRKIIDTKDVKALKAVLAPNIKYSFGGGEDTPKAFLEFQHLDTSAEKSLFWPEMKKVLSGGAVQRDREGESGKPKEKVNAFVMPYVFAAWPEKPEFDAFEYSAINSKDVSVYRTRSKDSAPMEIVSYLIIKAQSVGPTDKWASIKLPSGKTGYVESQYVTSPVGYRAQFAKRDGKWMLEFFLTGD